MFDDTTKLPIDEDDDSDEITSSDLMQFMKLMSNIGITPIGLGIPVQVDVEKTKTYVESCLASMVSNGLPNNKSCVVFKSLYRAITDLWIRKDEDHGAVLVAASMVLLLHYHRCGMDNVSHVLLLSNSPREPGKFNEKDN